VPLAAVARGKVRGFRGWGGRVGLGLGLGLELGLEGSRMGL